MLLRRARVVAAICVCVLVLLGAAPTARAGWFSSSSESKHDHDHGHDHTHSHEIKIAKEHALVTCGSAIKLRHERSGFHLHSHDLKWGSGSRQQSVTAHGSLDDAGSLWVVTGPHPGTGKAANSELGDPELLEALNGDGDDGSCGSPGRPISCGETIRLRHARTRNWLHSHTQPTPLQTPGLQEVSGFGDGSGGDGDASDNWQVICIDTDKSDKDKKKKSGKSGNNNNKQKSGHSDTGDDLDDVDGVFWARGKTIRLKHARTGAMLFTARKQAFTERNCRGCPILGQLEVSAATTRAEKTSDRTLWLTGNGLYLPDNRRVRLTNEPEYVPEPEDMDEDMDESVDEDEEDFENEEDGDQDEDEVDEDEDEQKPRGRHGRDDL